jgi:hypothetical protein
MPTNPWYNKVNVSALGDDARRLILERVKHKLGFTKTLKALSRHELTELSPHHLTSLS